VNSGCLCQIPGLVAASGETAKRMALKKLT
jgi:hypothetical protein